MLCKYCGSEMIEGEPLCPQCGKAQEETICPPCEEAPEEAACPQCEEAPEEAACPQCEEVSDALKTPEKRVSKMALTAVVAAGLLVIALVAVLLHISGTRGEKETEPTAGTTEPTVEATKPEPEYTDEDRQSVVATLNGRELTVGELQVYYWMDVWTFLDQYQYYLSYMGLDVSAPLSEQTYGEDGETWQDFFLERALKSWQEHNVLCSMADAEDFRPTQEDQDFLNDLDARMEELAKTNGFDSAEELVFRNFGALATVQGYKNYVTNYYVAISYYSYKHEGMEFTQGELEACFQEHAESLAQKGITKETKYIDVRHILLMPEGGTVGEDGSTTYSDQEWAACQEKAQALYEQWRSGEATEDSFAALATEHTEDGGSQSTGGLYENVTEGWAVQEFNDWCFDASRKPGDHGLVKTSYGYHIMYFVDSKEAWVKSCKEQLAADAMNKLIESGNELYPILVNEDKLAIGNVDLA